MGSGEWGVGSGECHFGLHLARLFSYRREQAALSVYLPIPTPHSQFPTPYSQFPTPQ
ncbi:MAG: hypothetical protein KME64_24465 [Scytonematopsis contorta HA4267-MV1]|nr:hypothetical protein [Scytonematopsis contorta HA4267-MV1]